MISIEWSEEGGSYDVRQDDEWVGDFATLLNAANFALTVAALKSDDTVVLISTSKVGP